MIKRWYEAAATYPVTHFQYPPGTTLTEPAKDETLPASETKLTTR